jgi:hypothetical protein
MLEGAVDGISVGLTEGVKDGAALGSGSIAKISYKKRVNIVAQVGSRNKCHRYDKYNTNTNLPAIMIWYKLPPAEG